MGAGWGGRWRKDELGAPPQGLRGQPPPGGGTGEGAGTHGRAERGCTSVGKGWAAWVSAEGEEGGPGGRLEGGGVAVFSLNTVKTLAWNLHLWSSQPAGISSPSCGRAPGATGCTAPLPCALRWQLSGQWRGQEAWGDPQLPSSPRCPLRLFSLSLFACLGACANAACARRDPGASHPLAARIGFPPARSLEEVSPPSEAL